MRMSPVRVSPTRSLGDGAAVESRAGHANRRFTRGLYLIAAPTRRSPGSARPTRGEEMRSRDRTPEEWLGALGRDVRSSSRVGYRDLAAALRAAIVSGEVPVGTRLPPQRELASLLSIGRT